MRSEKRLLPVERLEALVIDLLMAAGTSSGRAKEVAKHLVEADLTGHSSHGVGVRLPRYLDLIHEGILIPSGRIQVVKKTSGLDIVDGGWCFGQVVALYSLLHCLKNARRYGAATVTFRRSHHIGRLGYYGEIAAQEGLLALIMANVPHGRRQSHPDSPAQLLGTNPICLAVRWQDQLILVDTTTIVRAEGKVAVLHQQGKRAPEGWLRDSEGRPTTDPGVLYSGSAPGSLWSLGGADSGYKGFALAMMVDLLCGLVSRGGLVGANVPIGANNGWMHLIDIQQFMSTARLGVMMDAWLERLRTAPTISGAASITLPGEPEMLSRGEKCKTGLEINDKAWEDLKAAAKKWGISSLKEYVR